MTRTSVLVACFAAAFSIGSASSTAQAAPNTQDGFVFQLSPGLGYYSMTAEDALGTEVAFSGETFSLSLMLGGTIMPGLHVGGGFFLDRAFSPTLEIGGQEAAGTPDFQQFVLGLGPFVDYYLDPAGGLHFQGFFGWGGVETSTEAGGAGGSDPTGLVVYLGAGYDVFLSDEWSVGGMARFAYGPFALNEIDYPTIAPALLLTLTWS